MAHFSETHGAGATYAPRSSALARLLSAKFLDWVSGSAKTAKSNRHDPVKILEAAQRAAQARQNTDDLLRYRGM